MPLQPVLLPEPTEIRPFRLRCVLLVSDEGRTFPGEEATPELARQRYNLVAYATTVAKAARETIESAAVPPANDCAVGMGP